MSQSLKPNPTKPLKKKIINKELKKEMSKSYIDYSMSVIVGRAIPDVRDGLKPVQRRILYSMDQNNFYYNHSHHKSARIVGDCLGKYHPHGDSSVYQAMVRLAQDFKIRYMLIDGQGNFGSIDGDNAAAMRYTEARMAKISQEIMQDLNMDTVNFVDNFDGSLQEPAYFPSKLPVLLLNGSIGIAVGMSTSMAPHNLIEVNDAICAAIDMGPENFTPDDVANYILGPDFPTGGIIMGRQGSLEAIHTGKGSIVIRSKTEIIPDGAGNKKDAIIVTEIPYMVNKSHLIKKIAKLVNKKVIKEISDIRDESDRDGMRIVIELKQNADSNACLYKLFHKSQLQKSFNIINLALINNGLQPKILNYAEIIQEFIDHREKIIQRRTLYKLKKAKARLHILDGLLIAIDNIDEVIKLIKQSENPSKAAEKLIFKFNLSKIQASEILKMPLSRLTNLQTQKLSDEKLDIVKEIVDFEKILASQEIRYKIIKEETQELSKKYGDERKSKIEKTGEVVAFDYKKTVPEQECVIIITKNQAIKRMKLREYQAQGRGGKGKRGLKMREEDIIEDLFIASSHDTILLFTQQGRIYSIPAYRIPMVSRNSKGKAIVNYVNLKPDEVIVDITDVAEFDEERSLIFVSAKGIAKKSKLGLFSNIRKTGIICMNIKEGDRLIRAKLCNPNDEILIATKNGSAIHFMEKELRSLGRSAMGVKGISLRSEDDEVVDLVVGKPDTNIITLTKGGYGKQCSLDLYRLTHRAGKGVINIKLRSDNDEVIASKSIPTNMNLLLASKNGQLIRIKTEDIRETGRATMGVIVMRFDDDDEVSCVAICDPVEPIDEPGNKSEDILKSDTENTLKKIGDDDELKEILDEVSEENLKEKSSDQSNNS